MENQGKNANKSNKAENDKQSKPEEKSQDYKSFLHPSAHSYLPKEEGMINDVHEKESGTFDTSELEGDDALKKEEEG